MNLTLITVVAGFLVLMTMVMLVIAQRRHLVAQRQEIDLERGRLAVEQVMLDARQRARHTRPLRCPQCGFPQERRG